MLSCCSKCSSMSSGTERENSVSRSCILEPEGPAACRRREDGNQQWQVSVFCPHMLPAEGLRAREGYAACH